MLGYEQVSMFLATFDLCSIINLHVIYMYTSIT